MIFPSSRRCVWASPSNSCYRIFYETFRPLIFFFRNPTKTAVSVVQGDKTTLHFSLTVIICSYGTQVYNGCEIKLLDRYLSQLSGEQVADRSGEEEGKSYKVCLKCELPVSGVPQLGCGRKELVHIPQPTAHSPYSGDTIAYRALFLLPITVRRIFQHSSLTKT